MRRHSWSGATALVVLSLVAAACGEKGTSAPGVTSPTTPTVPVPSPIALSRSADTLTVDQSLQLSAILPSVSGASSSPTTWTSSDPTIAIVTQAGVVYALRSGKSTVTVASRGVSASTTVTVRSSIRQVAFDSDTTAISLTESVKLPYRVIDSDGATVDISTRNVEWTSGSAEIAPLTGAATVTGRSIGRTDVRLSVDGRTGITAVKVVQKAIGSVTVSPAAVALVAGQSVQLVPTTMDVHGVVLTGRTVSYSVADASVATVSSTGLVSSVKTGSTIVTVIAETKKAQVPVTVSAVPTTGVPVATVAVTLNASSLVVGQTTQANAQPLDVSSNHLTGRTIAWTSSDPSVASVASSSGLVTALKAGSTSITAMSEGKSGFAVLTVTAPANAPASVATVAVSFALSPVVIGQSTQATATVKDSAGNVLTGRAVTWVSSDATIGSVDANGTVMSVKAGSVAITAGVSGKTGSAVFTAAAPTLAVHMISITTSASTLKIGEGTQVSGVVRDPVGTSISGVPIFWSSAPTNVATITSTGVLTGRGVGSVVIYAKADTVTRSITVSVTDSATVVVPNPDPVPVPANGSPYGVSTPAELPRLAVVTGYPTATRQVRLAATANLQAAIDAAVPGDELLLAPGATYTGNFTLPNKGTSTAWIVIRTDGTLPAPGTRMTPSLAVPMAKIISSSPFNESLIVTALGAHHYRFVGVEMGVTTAVAQLNALIRFGAGDFTQTAANTAHHLILDRVYLHGTPTTSVSRCLALNSGETAIMDSWFAQCHGNGGDSQAIAGWNGPGPFLIENNHLEGGHEVIVFGGGSFTVTNGSPSDITVRGNHIMRPLSWKGIWQAKNLVETKHVKRLLIEGNVVENNWADAQNGFAFVMKAENQDNDTPWTTSQDITIRYNRIRNTGSVFSLSGQYSAVDPRPTILSARFTVYDNIIENVNVSPYSADGIAWQLLNGLSDVAMFHNTTYNAGQSMQAILFDGAAIQRMTFHSNAVYNGQYGVFAAGGSGTLALANFAPSSMFKYNVIVGGDCNNLPTTTLCPSSMPSTFTMGYDSRPMGADVSKVTGATQYAVVAP
ncbi:MAG: Ig-like domain-containing protein [Gemmatimonadaceae bacterium]